MAESDFIKLVRRIVNEELDKCEAERKRAAVGSEEKSPLTGRISTVEAARKLKIHPKTLLRWARKCNVYPIRIGRGYFYLERDIAAIKTYIENKVKDIPEGYLTVDEVSAILKKSTATIISWINSRKIPGRKVNGRWLMKEEDLEEAEFFVSETAKQVPPGYLSGKAAAEKYEISSQTISGWRKDKSVRSIWRKRRLYFCEEDIEKRMAARRKSNRIVPDGYLLFPEVAQRLGLSLKTLRKRMDRGWIRGDKKGNRWLFKEEYVKKLVEKELDYLNYKEAAKFYGVTTSTIFLWAKQKRIPAEQMDGQWRFPKDKLPPHPLPAKVKERKVPEGYLTREETARRLGITQSTLYYRTQLGKLKGEKFGSYLYYLESVVEAELERQSQI